MTFGLSNDQFETLQKTVIEPLKKMNARVFVFGSRTRKAHHPFSDIDILYIEQGAPILDTEISLIKEKIENSNLVITVDIVNDKNLAASYREIVHKEKIEV